jgi:hypothetical protein
MFCPACGLEYNQKLNYCKNCGAELGQPAPVEIAKVGRPRFGFMFLAIALLALAGTGFNFIAYYNLAQMGLHGAALMFPFVLGTGTIGLVALLLGWQLSRLISFYREASLAVRYQQPVVQPTSQQAFRPSTPIDTSSSVVEHTTRHFVPAYREPPES